MTVGELREKLAHFPDDMEVRSQFMTLSSLGITGVGTIERVDAYLDPEPTIIILNLEYDGDMDKVRRSK